MKTPFQKMLLNKIQEQSGMDILQQHLRDFPEPDPVDKEVIPNLSQNAETANNLNVPDEFYWNEECGCYLSDDYDGNFYWVYVAYVNAAGVWTQTPMMTQQIGPYTVAVSNGAMQLVGTNPDGVPYVMPNMWVQSWGNIYIVVYQNPVTDTFWICLGDPTSPPVEWYNPSNGQVAGGDSVDYAGWAVDLGFQFNEFGFPIGGEVPILPGGGSPFNVDFTASPPGAGSPGNALWLNFSNTFGGPSTEVDKNTHRRNWNYFATWYHDYFGNWPPKSLWPDDADWWENWTENAQGWNV